MVDARAREAPFVILFATPVAVRGSRLGGR